MLEDDGTAMVLDSLDMITVPAGSVAACPARAAPFETASIPTGSRYGEKRGFDLPALSITAGLHVLLGLALLGLGTHVVKSKPLRLVAVDLSAPPPAPPPPSPEKTTPQKLPVTMQRPVVQVPVMPQPPIALSPVQISAPVAQVSAPAAPPAPPAAPAAPSVVTSNSLGTRMISGAPPRYPMESRRKREQGTVELLIILGIDGAVETISVRHSSGFAQLDNAALTAVRRWRWSPTLQDGTPVKVRGVVEIPFVLKGE